MAFQLRGEKKHQAEVKLCEKADQVVAVGPKLLELLSVPVERIKMFLILTQVYSLSFLM